MRKDCRETIEEFLLHLPFLEKGLFRGRLGFVLSCGVFGVREIIEYLGDKRDLLAMFDQSLDSMFLSELQ